MSELASHPSQAKPCPICKLPLFAAEVASLPALHCAECQGLGLPRDTLMKLQPYGVKELAKSPEERGYKRPPFFEPRQKPPFLICPFCSKRMKADKLGSVALELCEACSALWLDGPKAAGFSELIGPYKSRMSKARQGGPSRLQRMKDGG